MGAPLRHPPLIEAICEFRYARESRWDWTIPGQLYDRIREEFENRSESGASELQLAAGEGGVAHTVRTTPQRVRLQRSDGSAMVQVGPHVLLINHLRPYPNWDGFKALILRIYREHSLIWKEGQLERIGLRYVNRLEPPSESFSIGSLISLDPQLHGPLDRPVATFYQRYELMYEQPPGILIHQTGLASVEGKSSLMLDLDFVRTGAESISTDELVAAHLESAHDRIEEAFIASLNEGRYKALTGV